MPKNGKAGNQNGMNWLWYPTRMLVLYIRGNGTCIHCGVNLCSLPKGQTTVDHILPRCKGGDNSITNLLPACISCNSRRGSQTLELFYAGNADKLARIVSEIEKPITADMRKRATELAEQITGRSFTRRKKGSK